MANFFPFHDSRSAFPAPRFPLQEFAQTDDAMGTLGFGEAEKAAVFRVLAALLHLGNVRFEVW